MVVLHRPLIGTLFMALLAPEAFAQHRQLTATVTDQEVMIAELNQPVLVYQRATKSKAGMMPRAGYVHPLYGLDGEVLTEDFPIDHRHHRGVFWAWHQVWVGDEQIGDPWLCKDFEWNVEAVEIQRGEDSVALHALVGWRSPSRVDDVGDPIGIIKEKTAITVYPRQSTYRVIDFDISLLALLRDVRIGGSEDAKGYGGFSPRIKLTPEQRFTAATGELEPVRTAMDVGSWVDIANQNWGLTMLTHRQNPGTRGKWILRRRASMQNAVYPGRDPVSVSTTQPTRLRYRLVVHDGTVTSKEIDELQSSLNAMP